MKLLLPADHESSCHIDSETCVALISCLTDLCWIVRVARGVQIGLSPSNSAQHGALIPAPDLNFHHVVNSFERLYDGLWARPELDHDDSSSSRNGNSLSASPSPAPKQDEGSGVKSCRRTGAGPLRGTNSGSQWSMSAEVSHLQRRVADLAAELQVRCTPADTAPSSVIDLHQWLY